MLQPVCFSEVVWMFLRIRLRKKWQCTSYIIKDDLIIKVRVVVFDVTFNNISAISWRSVLLVEETAVLGDNHRPVTSHCQTLLLKLYRVHLAWEGFEITTLILLIRYIHLQLLLYAENRSKFKLEIVKYNKI